MPYSVISNRAFSIVARSGRIWGAALLILGAQFVLNIILGSVLKSNNVVSEIIVMIIGFAFDAVLTGVLIYMVNNRAEGLSDGIGGGLNAGLAKTPRLAGLQVMAMIPIWLTLFLVTGTLQVIFSSLGQPGALSSTNLMSLFTANIWAILIPFLIVSLIVEAIMVGGERAIVLEESGVFNAYVRSFHLLFSHFTNFIVLFLYILGIYFAFVLLGFFAGYIGAPAIARGDPLVGILLGLFSVVAGGFYEMLTSAIWTLAFRYWQGKPVVADITPVALVPPQEPDSPLLHDEQLK